MTRASMTALLAGGLMTGLAMTAGAQAVLGDDKAIAAVVKYIAGLPATSVKPAGKFDARNGNNLYQGK